MYDFLLSIAFLSSLSVCKQMNNTEKNTLYLKEYFDIDVTVDDFYGSLSKIVPDLAIDSTNETCFGFIKSSVIAANHQELALSYTANKTQERIKFYNITKDIDSEYKCYVLCALDTQLIGISDVDTVLENNMTDDQIVNLLMSVAEANGVARNYIGYSNDPSIFSKVNNMYETFTFIDDDKLNELGRNLIENQIVTGFNIFDKRYSSRFLSDLTISYCHDQIKHIHQLIALLNSENIVAKVQIEPMVSCFEYLLDWGPVPEPDKTNMVKKVGDIYISYAIEVDLSLEFDNDDDMNKFDSIVISYAMKQTGKEGPVGLIYSSWWAPMYRKSNVTLSSDGYKEIGECVAVYDNIILSSFCLPENLTNTYKFFKRTASDLFVKQRKMYSNIAFFDYLKGN